MKEPFEDPPRWREHRDQSDQAERTIGQDLRAIKNPTPLSGAQMARIAAGLHPVRTRGSLRWLVVAASLVLLVATGASAARLHLLPRWLTGASAPPPVPRPEPRGGHRKSSVPGHAPKTTAAPVAPMDVPAPATNQTPAAPTSDTQGPAAEPTRAQPVHRPVAAPMPRQATDRDRSWRISAPAPAPAPPEHPQVAARPEPTPPPSAPALAPPVTTTPPPAYASPTRAPRMAMLDPPRPLPQTPAAESPKPVDDAQSSKLLADAIRLLRVDGHPQSALALLDRQATIFEQSPYRHEALLIRVEALLALKRDAELLRLLDGMPLADVAASRTLLATRGRLRAAAQRCAEAVSDFDRVLAEPGRKNRQALLGRAQCREALGNREGAQADRDRYRRESSPSPENGATRP